MPHMYMHVFLGMAFLEVKKHVYHAFAYYKPSDNGNSHELHVCNLYMLS
jgi:hypothetical protein